MSWKVRRAAAKCLDAVVSTRHEMLPEFYRSVSPALVCRFKVALVCQTLSVPALGTVMMTRVCLNRRGRRTWKQMFSTLTCRCWNRPDQPRAGWLIQMPWSRARHRWQCCRARWVNSVSVVISWKWLSTHLAVMLPNGTSTRLACHCHKRDGFIKLLEHFELCAVFVCVCAVVGPSAEFIVDRDRLLCVAATLSTITKIVQCTCALSSSLLYCCWCFIFLFLAQLHFQSIIICRTGIAIFYSYVLFIFEGLLTSVFVFGKCWNQSHWMGQQDQLFSVQKHFLSDYSINRWNNYSGILWIIAPRARQCGLKIKSDLFSNTTPNFNF